jgi:hypothetical protein
MRWVPRILMRRSRGYPPPSGDSRLTREKNYADYWLYAFDNFRKLYSISVEKLRNKRILRKNAYKIER